MELVELATSAGINIGLAILFFALYSVFRKQHANAGVYFTRHLLRERQRMKVAGEEKDSFSLESLVPSAGWVKRAWDPIEEDILKSSGVDAVVFLRVFIFCMRFLMICTIVGFGILAPLNFTDTYLADNPSEKEEHSYGTLEKLTILNISFGSMRLWIHFGVLYFISLSAYALLYIEFKHITNLRLEYLAGALPQPDQFTVLVQSIPKPENEELSYSDNVDYFFRRFHPIEYLSHHMVYKSSHVTKLLNELERLKLKIFELKQKPPSERKPRRAGFCGLFGPLVDPIELHMEKLEDVHRQVRQCQMEFRQKKKEVPTAFVTVRTRWGAAVTAQTQQSVNPMQWVTQWAPEPRDIDWPNMEIPYNQIFIRKIVAAVLAIALTFIYYPIVLGVKVLENLDTVKKYLPQVVVDNVLNIPAVSFFVQGYVPALLLAVILYICPSIFFSLSRFEGHPSVSHQERKASSKMFSLLAGNIFLAAVLSGSLISISESFTEDPKSIPRRLAEAVPKQANFFITYVMTTGWAGMPLEILQSGSLVLNFLKRHTVDKNKPLLDQVYSLPYYRTLPTVLFFVLLGLVYSIINPLILPFLLIYFILGYLVFRNQILHVYEPAYETGGQYWPEIHSRTIGCIVFMQVLFIGMFSLKGLKSASFASIPLPFLSWLFHEHCRHRFLPIFHNFNLESTMKKDLVDEESGRKDEVLNTIRDAYLHPALRYVDLNVDQNSKTQRLLPESSSFVEPDIPV
ncbi:hypothetical protein KC19_7G094000 [Ceratodon purpureus]|uniref:Uncharacterized protein n=1 Tax=Ceratodon purpureus TaxID=3225 RepID=A0A8T0H9B9_CERPU|nr:hypothetical protein KC19_7G094000 [Ceratodon purpureus]